MAGPTRFIVAALAAAGIAAGFLVLRPHCRGTEAAASFRLARDFENDGDVRRAGEAYAVAERGGLDSPEFLNQYGLFHMHNGGLTAAEALFRRALERDRAYGPAHLNLAQLHLRRERNDAAAQEYEIAAKLMPARAAELYVNAGMLHLGAGRRERATAMFREALRVRPGFVPAEEGLAESER